MDQFRIFEISVYTILDFLPNLLLTIIPFRNHMRFSLRTTTIIISFLYFIIVLCRIVGLRDVRTATFLTVILMLVYIFFYKVSFQVELSKLLFILLIILNYGSFTSILYSFFTTHFQFGIKDRPYSLRSSTILFFILLISYPLIAYVINKKIRPLIVSEINNKIWNYLWLVPATFCLSYYYNLFSNGGYAEYTRNSSNVLFAALFNIGSLFATFLISQLVKESNDSIQIKSENYMLHLQTVHHEHLKSRIQETRRIKHDIRQILTVIQTCLNDNNMIRLKEYMIEYTNSLPPDTAITYCDNYALNALFVYYGDTAQKNDITFYATVDYPSTSCISDSDAVILFGNLLENALEACLRQTEKKKFISLIVKNVKNSIVITLDNSFNSIIKKNGNQFISSKSNSIGIGISSINKVTNKYKGYTKYEYCDKTFSVSVVLNM